MKYLVSIANQTVEVEVDGDRVVIDGVAHAAELRPVAGTPIQNLLLDGASWIIPVEPAGRGRWVLQRWGERFEAEVLDERTHHIQSLVGAGKAQTGPAALKAPMPGLVVRVLVEPGSTVAAGQGVAVLEAMKMENELKAAGPGVVDAIHAKPGQAVEKGAVLVSFRPVG
ncbi:MAG: biotin/lipoyl-containing protein [Gemmatimonadales bacterium]|nr:biotin/lipoyl-containing protein [Gemmatimonadales bacterium]